ncbi:MAG: 1-acyl-sn-glycerol-3-phosphate acyltransferase [Myxococcales bacterium]|nr:1-acyl-sn-glycerol-3-phosphate acyltransferase [Myxococcales bacterium]
MSDAAATMHRAIPDRHINTPTTAMAYTAVISSIAGFLPMMALARVTHRGDVTQRVPGRWMRRLGRTIGRVVPHWHFDVEGELPADIRERAYVVVANHESALDPVLLSYLDCDMRWIAKEELFRVPLVGWAMKLSGDIPLRRGRGDSVRAMMAECERALAGGIPVMIFPEGTRSKTDELLPFKLGAFALAIKAGVPILPVAIAGTRLMRPIGKWEIQRARSCAKILPPIPITGATEDDAGRLAELARATITAALPDLRARYEGEHAAL